MKKAKRVMTPEAREFAKVKRFIQKTEEENNEDPLNLF